MAIHYSSYNQKTDDYNIAVLDKEKDRNYRLRSEVASYRYVNTKRLEWKMTDPMLIPNLNIGVASITQRKSVINTNLNWNGTILGYHTDHYA